jgi:Calx-beta domain-containing protein/hemolysin type calcium-binding protein
MRRTITGIATLGMAGLLATVVLAGTVSGTPKNDTLRGTAKADNINGKAGNDKLYGMAGNDKLIGGAGNDLLDGGPGADSLNCGPGKDAAKADDSDSVSASCEKVSGITPPEVSIADASIVEGNAGNATLAFQVTLSKASKRPASMDYATANGSASSPADYASASGKLVFAPGETSKAINVSVVGDAVFESNETVTVALSGPVNAKISDASATGTITNDDPAYRTGNYAGSTAQGKPISFGVSSDAKQIVNVQFGFDLNCTEVRGFTINDTLRIVVPLTIGADGTFSLNDSESDAESKVTFGFNGKLTAPSSASGTFTLAIELYGIPGIGTIHCQTGATPVSWNAS